MRLWKFLLTAFLLSCATSHAEYTITFSETGGNVVATGSGTINTTSLSLSGSSTPPLVNSRNAHAYIGGTAGSFNVMRVSPNGSVVGPTSFGVFSTDRHPDTAAGPLVGIIGNYGRLLVPVGYVSGNTINSSATWNGATFASLGLTPGTYEWTWSSGATADKFIVQIPPKASATTHSIPTLSEWGLIVMSLLLATLGFMRIRRKH